MGMKLTPTERLGLSPDEIAALEADTAEQHLATMGDDAPPASAGTTSSAAAEQGDDGQDEDGDADAGAADADADAAGAADQKQAEAGALTAEQLAAIAADTSAQQQPAEPPKLPTYTVPERDFEAERKALRASRRDLQAQWDKGELSDEELQAKLDEVDDKIDALTAERVRADTLRELNEQHQREAQAKIEAEYSAATTAIIKAAAESTTAKVDYLRDKTAQKQFDMALDMLQADPENAGKTPRDLVQQAHKAVLVIRGLPTGAPASAPAPSPAPAAPRARDVPVTLGGLPNAGQVPLEDETMAQVQKLSGEDLEQFMARMTPAQQQRLLRQIDNASALKH